MSGNSDSAMNMNIDTLLEAAIFLEKRSATRDDKPSDSSNDNEDDNSSKCLSPGEDGKEKRRSGGAGTREVHNKLEKNRRAHLKECFEQLKSQIPTLDDKRTSNLSILRCSLRYIQMLKRKEKEFEHEMQRLAQQKVEALERIHTLKRELSALNIDVDIKQIMAQARTDDDDETASASTATADNESPILSDVEDEDETDGHEPMDVDQKHVSTLPPISDPVFKHPGAIPVLQAPSSRLTSVSHSQITKALAAPTLYQQSTGGTPVVNVTSQSVASMASSHVSHASQLPQRHEVLMAALGTSRPAVTGRLVTVTPSLQAALATDKGPVTLATLQTTANQMVITQNGTSPQVTSVPNFIAAPKGLATLDAAPVPVSVTSTIVNNASSQLLTAVAAVNSTPCEVAVASCTQNKIPVNQILQQTLAQRIRTQHLQQQQLRIQQQIAAQSAQQQIRIQLEQNTSTTAATPISTPSCTITSVTDPKLPNKVLTVKRPALPALTQLRQAVAVNQRQIAVTPHQVTVGPRHLTVNQLVPSILPPGASILTAPASLQASNQVAALAALTKLPATSSATNSMGVTSHPILSVATSSASSTPVTFTTMKQFLTPAQLQGMQGIVSLGSAPVVSLASPLPNFGQFVARPGLNQATVAMTPIAGNQLTPSSLSTLTPAQAAHPIISSLAHVTPMTQLMSPAGTIQVPQLSLMNSPIMRTLSHIPIQLNHPIQLNQAINLNQPINLANQPINISQLVKPVVMVTMPSVVPSTATGGSTVQVQVPVSQT